MSPSKAQANKVKRTLAMISAFWFRAPATWIRTARHKTRILNSDKAKWKEPGEFTNLISEVFAATNIQSKQAHVLHPCSVEHDSRCVCNSYPLYTALLSDWRVSDSLPLAYLHECTCKLDIGAFLHCKEFEELLCALGLWHCESWGIGENKKVKADSTTERCFS